MDKISFRVDPALKRQLEAEARSAGVSPSDLAREALREHLRRLALPDQRNARYYGPMLWLGTSQCQPVSAALPASPFKSSAGVETAGFGADFS